MGNSMLSGRLVAPLSPFVRRPIDLAGDQWLPAAGPLVYAVEWGPLSVPQWVDPALVEAQVSMVALTLQLEARARLVLTVQLGLRTRLVLTLQPAARTDSWLLCARSDLGWFGLRCLWSHCEALCQPESW